MKYAMWALASLIFLAACTNSDGQPGTQEAIASATLLNIEEYQQENSFAFECNTTGFTPHTFNWDFGDGTKRTTPYKGVAHTYFKSGTYAVTCVATDDVINETSMTSITVDLGDLEEYMPEEESIFDDMGLIDLLNDVPEPYLSVNNTTAPPRERLEQYDYGFYDFTFDDEEYEEQDEEEQASRSNTTANPYGQGALSNTTGTNATNTSNSTRTNTTKINQSMQNWTVPNTTGSINSTPGNPNSTSIPLEPAIPANESLPDLDDILDDEEERDGKKRDKRDDEEDRETEDEDIVDPIVSAVEDRTIDKEIKSPKAKKALIADLKFKWR